MPTEPRLYGNGFSIRNDRSGSVRNVSWSDGKILFRTMDWDCDEATYVGDCSHHLVVLTDTGVTGETVVRDGHKVYYDGRDHPGALSFVPAGVERRCSYRDVSLSYSAIWIAPEFEAQLTEAPRAISHRLLVNGSDDRATSLISWLRELSSGEDKPDDIVAESIARLILLHFATADTAPPATHNGRLDARRLRRVDEYVDANLRQNIALSDLAALVHMPIDTFARRFKQATGKSPYAHVMDRRLARAQSLLGDSNWSIASIALASGFSSQSHMTTSFRKVLGTTPGRWRG